MHQSKRLFTLLSLALLPACSIRFGDWGGPDVWVEESASFVIPAADLEGLSCQTHNGRIVATGKDGDDSVQVTARKKAGGDDLADARDAMAAIRIIKQAHDGHLELGWEWAEGRDPDWRGAVSFEIEQPSSLSVKAQTHNGDVTIENVDGSCQAQTHNGRIEVAAGGGEVNLVSHNGGVFASLSAQQGVGGSITTHNGSVRVDLADAVSAKIRCSTHNGSISSDLDLADRFQGRNFLSGDLGQGGSPLAIQTHNGSIRLR